MAIKLTAGLFHIAADVHYICPMTQQQVTSHRQRNNIMREKNVVDANDLCPQKSFEKAEKEQQRDRDLIRQLKKDLTTGSDRPFTERQLTELIPSLEHV